MSKIDVNGPCTIDVYKWLRMHSELYFAEYNKAQQIPWNYSKFIIVDGKVDSYWDPLVDPTRLTEYVNRLLQGVRPKIAEQVNVSGQKKRFVG